LPVDRPLAERVLAGDPRAVARAISLVEDERAEGDALIGQIYASTGKAYLIGVTGAPGAGKSTLVDRLTVEIRRAGLTVGIIAVDPSSPFTGGAVLGDRIRMGDVHGDPRVFIRSLAARGHLGGLTRTARAVLAILTSAPFDIVLIETVGTGQSEVEIARIAQTTVVVCPPGLGDDVQALKAGVLEVADVLVVNKSDLPDAERTERELRAMLALRRADRRPPLLKTSAASGAGIPALADVLAASGERGRSRGAGGV